LTVLQVIKLLQQLSWNKLPAPQQLHSQIEAMRWCWRDRLTLFGDPELSDVPLQKLLSDDYAQQCAEQVRAAVEQGRPIDHKLATTTQGGTLSFSAIDKQGNMAALTLTHGEAFGAKVTVDGLGLTLGHGMSRFDTNPTHPNAPGPGKRPLNNMAPFIVTKAGRPVVAVGGRGGRKIPNSVLEFLLQYVVLGRSFHDAMAAPRFHTEGLKNVEYQPSLGASSIKHLATLGYQLKSGSAATLSAVGIDPENDQFVRAMS
jgi:gamma-glutamyltranspeptidase/glutathione hydrolase